MLHSKCPSCGGESVDAFFRIENAPIFSVVTVKSKMEALAVPRKDIELSFCNDCGLIFNRLFDTTIEYFTAGYEDQQGFSGTFMEFLTRIARGLIDRYDLTGKTLMEIGCGKGEFLDLLVNLNNGTGIGIDPAYEEGRQTNPDITFYKEFYSVRHGKAKPDIICCRHTLEHIYDCEGFLQMVRNSINEKPNTVVLFEVPDIKRILELQAFWDIYYEHCAYYSAGSLARAFKMAGYAILDLRLDYYDQYLLIEATPSKSRPGKTFEIEESVAELRVLVNDFNVKVNQRLEDWRKILTDLKIKERRAVIWGGGSKAVGFLTNFSDVDLIDYVVDINPHREGNFIPGIGKMYVQPKFLKEYQPEAVIIMNDVYREEIETSLRDMHVFADIYVV
jgi:hypothetical protein